jgi:hypothetical protein
MGVGGQRHASTALPPRNTRYPSYRLLGGPQDRSGRVRKISPPSSFDPRTVQPVASRYTDWATPDPALMIRYFATTRRPLGLVGSTKTTRWRPRHEHATGIARYTIFDVKLWEQSTIVPLTWQQLVPPKRRHANKFNLVLLVQSRMNITT